MADKKIILHPVVNGVEDTSTNLLPQTDWSVVENKTLKEESISTGNAFELSDNSGNVIFKIDDEGNIASMNFDSTNCGNVDDVKVDGTSVVTDKVANITSVVKGEDTSSNALEFADENGNVVMQVDTQGELQTKNFDSTKTGKIEGISTGNAFELSDDDGNVILEINSTGGIKTASFDSEDCGNVDDVKVNGTSVVTNKVANISQAVQPSDATIDNALEIADASGNVALQIDASGNLKTKNFDSTEKLDKVSTSNKVYGTDASGNQTTYDKDSFGQVDDVKVNGTSVVTNKVANISQAVQPSSESISNALEFADADGNVVMQVTSTGDLQTKNFDSTELSNKVEKVSTASKVYGTDSTGAQTTYDKDDFGKVDDVKLDGTSVVTNKVASLTSVVKGQTVTENALEFADESGNVVMQVTTTGNLQTKLFDSATALDQSDVVDNLTSTSTIAPLSANQGKALKTLIDNLPSPMVFKGTLGTGGTITELPTASTSTIGHTYKVITAGTYAGQTAKVGDLFICNDTPAWILVPSGDEPSGTVTNIATGLGLTGGPITTSGTIAIDSTVVAQQTDLAVKKDSSTIENALEFADASGNVALQVDANGDIQTKNFNSSELGTLSKLNNVTDSNISGTISDSHIASASTWNAKQNALPTTSTAGKILTSTSTAGTVQWSDAPETGVTSLGGKTGAITLDSDHLSIDNNNELSVTNIAVEPSSTSIDNALEFTDASGNVVMQVDSNGDIQTKNFDSSELGEMALKDLLTADDIPTGVSADKLIDGTTNHVFTATDDTNLSTLVTNVGSHTVATDVPSGAVFTDTKPKYNGTTVTSDTNIPEVKTSTWDNKQDALPTTTTAGKVLKSTSTAGTVEWGDAPASGVTSFATKTGAITIDSAHLSMEDNELNVTNIAVEPSSTSIENALEFADSSNNIALQVDSLGNIQTKNFDSTEVQEKLPTTSTAGLVLTSTSTAGTVEWGTSGSSVNYVTGTVTKTSSLTATITIPNLTGTYALLTIGVITGETASAETYGLVDSASGICPLAAGTYLIPCHRSSTLVSPSNMDTATVTVTDGIATVVVTHKLQNSSGVIHNDSFARALVFNDNLAAAIAAAY